jgi:spore coat polysaccharide biosynthesis protein SpsF
MREIFKKEDDNIVAIIQARMCSTRLPGKVMKDISGKPMLWHVIYRVKYSKLINKIVVATSTNKEDDIIENFCKENRILFYRGDEEDVLKRYYEAAKIYNGNKIVRITSDCPLIDPEIVDIVIKEHLKDEVDYTSNTIERTFPRGLDTEVFNFEALERANEMAKEKYQREHVTIFIYENPHLFKIKNVRNFKDLSHLRWTVDEERDLIFVREIYKRLYKGNIFFMRDILEVLEKEIDLKKINEMVKQKPVK